MTNLEEHVWGEFNKELKDLIVKSLARLDMAKRWDDIQPKIASELKNQFKDVRKNMKLSGLGVSGSEAQIDIVFSDDLDDEELGGFLLHVSGGSKYPRHEKELLAFMAVSLAQPRFSLAVLVTCLDNKMTLEGKRDSFSYCRRSLMPLAEPVLKKSNLKGLLIIGLSTPGR